MEQAPEDKKGCGCALEIPIGLVAFGVGMCDGYIQQKSHNPEWSIEQTPIVVEQALRVVNAHPVVKYIPTILQGVSSLIALSISYGLNRLTLTHQVEIEAVRQEKGFDTPLDLDGLQQKALRSAILQPGKTLIITFVGHYAGRALGHVM